MPIDEKQEALQIIAEKTAEAKRLVEECRELARTNDLPLHILIGAGRQTWGDGEYNEYDPTSSWQASDTCW